MILARATGMEVMSTWHESSACFPGWACLLHVNPAQPLTAAGEELDELDGLDRDLPNLKEV